MTCVQRRLCVTSGDRPPGRSLTLSSVVGLLVRQTACGSRLLVRIQARAAGTVTVTGLRPIPVDIAEWSVAVWEEEFRATKGNRS